MRTAGWLALSLALVLAAAEGDMLLARSKRRPTILFPGELPESSPDAPLELPDNLDLNTVSSAAAAAVVLLLLLVVIIIVLVFPSGVTI